MKDVDGPTIGAWRLTWRGTRTARWCQRSTASSPLPGAASIAVSTATIGTDYLRASTVMDEPSRAAWEQVRGFVAISGAVPRSYLEAFRRTGRPVVAVMPQGPGLAWPAVVPDSRGGMKQAVEHLLEHGHERIAFAGWLADASTQERYDAYRDTLAAHHIEPDPGLLFATPDNLAPGGRQAAERMLVAGLPCTAVVAGSGAIGVGIMSVLKEAGCHVPADQAVVVFEDAPGDDLLLSKLTSICPDLDSMGALAGQLLLRLVAGNAVERAPYLVETVCVRRRSCGCSPSSGSPPPAGPGPPTPRRSPASAATSIPSSARPSGTSAGSAWTCSVSRPSRGGFPGSHVRP